MNGGNDVCIKRVSAGNDCCGLFRIEPELGTPAKFPGRAALKAYR